MLDKKLAQMVCSSYTGCISNRAEIKKIVTKFINLSLEEIFDNVGMKMKEVIETLAGCLLTEEWGLGKETVKSLKYTELLCLIDNTRIDPPQDNDNNWPVYYSIDAELPQPPFRYLGISDIYILLKTAEKASDTIKLFLSINVNSFFAYLKSISNDGTLTDMWNTLRERADALKINMGPDVSIRNILKQAEEIRGTWTPWTPIRDYYNKVLFVFEIYSSLLIDCFKYAYPERFQLQNIINKYSQDEIMTIE